MTDIGVDENFRLEFGSNGDFLEKEGVDEYEQRLRLTITDYFFEHIGDRNDGNVVQKLRLQAKRAINDLDFIESVQNIEVTNQDGDSLHLSIEYNYDSSFEFEVI